MNRFLRAPLAQAALAGLLGTAAYVGTYGYSGAENPQHHQFRPLLEQRLDPELYPRDLYVPTLERIPSCFWTGSAAVLRATGWSPDAWFWAVFLAGTFAVFAGVWLLAFEAAGSVRAAWIACALTLLSHHLNFRSLLAHDSLLRDRADQTLATWPFLLAGLILWLRGRLGASAAGSART